MNNSNTTGSQIPPMSLEDAITELTTRSKDANMELWLSFIIRCLNEVEGFYDWFDKTYKRESFSIVIKIEGGIYVDLSQIRMLLIKMRGYELKDRRDPI